MATRGANAAAIDITEAAGGGEPLLMDTWEAARILNVSDSHVRRMIERGELQSRRLGQRVLVPRAEVDRIIAGL